MEAIVQTARQLAKSAPSALIMKPGTALARSSGREQAVETVEEGIEAPKMIARRPRPVGSEDVAARIPEDDLRLSSPTHKQ